MSTEEETTPRPQPSGAAITLPDDIATVSATDAGIEGRPSAQPTVVRVGEGEEVPKAPSKKAKKAKPKVVEVDNIVEGADDFAALLAEGAGASGGAAFEIGQEVEAVIEVISLHGEEIFLDLGGKATGYMLKEEVRDAEGELLLNPNMEFLVTEELHSAADGPLEGCNVIEMQQIPNATLWS